MKLLVRLLTPVLILIPAFGFGQLLSPVQKKQIFQELGEIIDENYVLQDSVKVILDRLEVVSGSYEFQIEHTPSQFASYLTGLLRETTRDAHFAVLHDSAMYQMGLAMQQNEGSASPQRMSVGGRSLGDERKNFFFTKLEILDGNIGYVKIEQMPPLEAARSTVDVAMGFVKHTDALIIDLRANPGGVGGFIPYLISYFLPVERQLLYSREFLAWDSTSHHYTHQDLGEDRYLNKPVYVLINRFTGSAATNMAYTMKNVDAAVLVGENTGSGYRGAHSATLFPLSANLVAIIPIGRVVNAKTNTNWRANGVDPDIACDTDNALSTAQKAALQDLLDSSSDPDISVELQAALENLQKRSSLPDETNATEDLSEYAGQYGETTITWENGKLFTKRPTVPIKLEIQRKEGDVFEIILPPNARGNVPDLHFNRENGVVVSLTTIRNGIEERTEAKN